MAGLYLHIPYCVKKCDYCDFTSFAEPDALEGYVQLLLQEIGLAAGSADGEVDYETVFLGGGTPSLLSGDQMARILSALFSRFSIAKGAECSAECNPGTASFEKLNAYRKAGINRLSIGLQSANDALLRRIGRIHTANQFFATLNAAREAGFTNVNADVMHGLPGQTQADYLQTLAAVCDAGVEHVSAYSLILEEGTPLFARVENGEEALPDEDEVADMQDAGIEYLASRGYTRYEISNFAKPGYECRHNLNYWKNGEYLGLGVAAHSAMRRKTWTRFANVETPSEYERLLSRGRRPIAETIRLFPADEMFECVMLGLRLTEGVDRSAFLMRFGVEMADAFRDGMDALRRRGWVEETASHIRLNRRGLDLQNEAVGCFM